MTNDEIAGVLEGGVLPHAGSCQHCADRLSEAIALLRQPPKTCATCKHAEVDDFEPSCIRCQRVGCGFVLPFGCILHEPKETP